MPSIDKMFDDPMPPDENDPEFIEESFLIHKDWGNKPEDLRDEAAEYREAYARWLEEQK